ncbi:MAG: MFS transporter [Bacillota bacterium]
MTRLGDRLKPHKDVIILGLSLLLWSLGLGLYNFIWPVYVRGLGATAVDYGLLVAIGMLASSVSSLPGGVWADLYDRKAVLIVGWAVALPAPLIYAFAPDWRWLAVGLVFYMVSAGSNPALQAYIVHATPPERLGATFNLVFAGFPLGLVVSPPIGGWVGERYGMRAVFSAAFVFYLLSTLILFWLSGQRATTGARDSHGAWEKRAGWAETFDPRVWLKGFSRANLNRQVLVVSAAFAAALAIQQIGLPFATPLLQDLTRLDLVAVGRLGSVAALSAFVLSPLIGRLADRVGHAETLVVSLFVFAGSMALVAAFPAALPLVVVGFALRGAGDGARGLMTAGVGRIIGKAALGQAYGVYNVLVGLFAVITPYAGGWLYELGPTWPFWVTAGLTALIAFPLAPLMDPTVRQGRGTATGGGEE